jgi:hypothetical protein
MQRTTSDCRSTYTAMMRVGVVVGVARAGRSPGPLFHFQVCPANRPILERRRRDSNPRYPVERYNTLAGCRLQPLGHSSGREQYNKDVVGVRRVRVVVSHGVRCVYWPLFCISSTVSVSMISGFSLAGLASRICCPETSSFILTRVAFRVAPKRMVSEEM